jgi:tetratricopeptide (TPR) repeat protein
MDTEVIRVHQGEWTTWDAAQIARCYELWVGSLGWRFSARRRAAHALATARAFYCAGLRLHRELVLAEVMERFERERDDGDPAWVVVPTHGSVSALRASAAVRYRAALLLHPQLAEACYALARLCEASGDFGSAADLYERAGRCEPAAETPPQTHWRANALWNAASVRARCGDPDRAKQLHAAAFERLDNFGVDQVDHARLLRGSGQTAAAAEQYDLLMPYRHRYAPELVDDALERGGEERDPLEASLVDERAGRRLVAFLNLHFWLPSGAGASELARAPRPSGWWSSLAFGRRPRRTTLGDIHAAVQVVPRRARLQRRARLS